MIATPINLHGAKLYIDKQVRFSCVPPLVIDVETDEKDNFVGLAATDNGEDVYYFTALSPALVDSLLNAQIVGHNVKFDIKQLIGWGVNVKPSQMAYDTILASYVQNTTKATHGLKDLAKEHLGLVWTSYKEMVGTGKNKVTLDKQPVEKVAAYCGMDCLATYRLWQHFEKSLTLQEKHYLETIELPTARALLAMELRGVKVDVEYLKELDSQFIGQIGVLDYKLQDQWFRTPKRPDDPTKLNTNSNQQVAWLLQNQGAVLPKTPKGNLKVDKGTLEQWKHLPAVPYLLEYSKIEKLKTTYTEALLEKQKNGRIYANFNQLTRDSKGVSVGISTGRLSSSNPNLQNIPTRSEEGKLIRQAFVAERDKVYIDADYSQIEPRLVAHFTRDPLFIRSFVDGRDIYEELVKDTDRSRADGKTFMLALLYGAQPKKLAAVFKCSSTEAESIVKRIMGKLPSVTAWIERTKHQAHKDKGVWTLFGRWIPLPGIDSDDRYERLHWERVAVNAIVQGSAAEIMKLALVRLEESGYSTGLVVHDEMLIEVDEENSSEDAHRVQEILENVTELEVPLLAEVGIGKTWGEAKI